MFQRIFQDQTITSGQTYRQTLSSVNATHIGGGVRMDVAGDMTEAEAKLIGIQVNVKRPGVGSVPVFQTNLRDILVYNDQLGGYGAGDFTGKLLAFCLPIGEIYHSDEIEVVISVGAVTFSGAVKLDLWAKATPDNGSGLIQYTSRSGVDQREACQEAYLMSTPVGQLIRVRTSAGESSTFDRYFKEFSLAVGNIERECDIGLIFLSKSLYDVQITADTSFDGFYVCNKY